MNLVPMRFKDYVWPHNPTTYTIEYQRKLAAHKVPFGRYCLQNLGLTRRVMRGEGAFVGKDAYSEFKKLAALFYQETPGALVHPVWQSAKVYFAELTLRQEPRADYVAYSFAFWEDYDGYEEGLRKVTAVEATALSSVQESAQYYVVISGDSLWRIAQRQGIGLAEILALNPQIKNPNRIYPGEQVRVQ